MAEYGDLNYTVKQVNSAIDKALNPPAVRGENGGTIIGNLSENIASGINSVAEGEFTQASGNYSHTEGEFRDRDGDSEFGLVAGSHGQSSHVEGLDSATGESAEAAHAEGIWTTALGVGSHSEGRNTVANNVAEHAEGVYNKSNDKTIHSVGIGTGLSNRKNAFEILNNGKIYVYGIGGYDGTNPDTAKSIQEIIMAL